MDLQPYSDVCATFFQTINKHISVCPSLSTKDVKIEYALIKAMKPKHRSKAQVCKVSDFWAKPSVLGVKK